MLWKKTNNYHKFLEAECTACLQTNSIKALNSWIQTDKKTVSHTLKYTKQLFQTCTSLWSAVKFFRRNFDLAPLMYMPREGYCIAARFFITSCLRSGGSPSTTITGVMFSWRRLHTRKNRFLQRNSIHTVKLWENYMCCMAVSLPAAMLQSCINCQFSSFTHALTGFRTISPCDSPSHPTFKSETTQMSWRRPIFCQCSSWLLCTSSC